MVLLFDGVDTVSTITLNGVTIGTTDNMFRSYVSMSACEVYHVIVSVSVCVR